MHISGLIFSATLSGAFSLAASQAPPADAALTECRTLLGMDLPNRAIQRCEEAIRLDPRLVDAYFSLGKSHHALWQQDLSAVDHRQKAAEHYRTFLATARGDTRERQRDRHSALSGVLGIYVFDGAREGDLEYANELARETSLNRNDLLVLATAYARNARPDLSVGLMKRQVDADPSDLESCQILATLYLDPVWNGQPRFDDSMATLEKCADARPGDPAIHYLLTTSFWDKAYQDRSLSDPAKLAYVEKGLFHADRALALKKDFLQAIIYKGILLRTKAAAIPDDAARQRLLSEASALSQRATALKASGVPLTEVDLIMQPPGPPPPPKPPQFVSDPVPPLMPPPPPPPLQGLRVGGNIKEPTKLVNVAPVYPQIAIAARVQGVVIIECEIGPDGRVTGTRVLRSVALLDQAAVDAVKQWVYAKTFLNGAPVAVIMTVTVTFKLETAPKAKTS